MKATVEERVAALEQELFRLKAGLAASEFQKTNEKFDFQSVGARIGYCMKQQHITQKQMGNMLGLHQSVISNIICGKRNIDIKNFAKIAKILNVSSDYLLFGEVSK